MPFSLNVPTLGILAATLVDFGTHEQKLRHLPAILKGEELWVQFLSEPSGGSDLAGVPHPGRPRRRRLRPQRLEDLELAAPPRATTPCAWPARTGTCRSTAASRCSS